MSIRCHTYIGISKRKFSGNLKSKINLKKGVFMNGPKGLSTYDHWVVFKNGVAKWCLGSKEHSFESIIADRYDGKVGHNFFNPISNYIFKQKTHTESEYIKIHHIIENSMGVYYSVDDKGKIVSSDIGKISGDMGELREFSSEFMVKVINLSVISGVSKEKIAYKFASREHSLNDEFKYNLCVAWIKDGGGFEDAFNQFYE